mgnify:CR=1 FL=1
MDLIDALLGEHGAFKALFDSVEKLDEIGVELAQIDNAISVLATELDTHAAFEDEQLFPALKAHVANDELMAEMYAEHAEIRAGLERIEDAHDIREAMNAVHHTFAVARRHFRKEEEIVYPLAHRILDDETRSRLGEAWVVARKVKTG